MGDFITPLLTVASTIGSTASSAASYIGPLLQVGSSIGEIIGGFKSMSGADAAAKANAKQAIVNARFEEQQSRRQAQRILAKQRAIGAASGIDTSSGSFLELMLDSAREAEEEALTIRQGGRIQANQARYAGAVAKSRALGDTLGGFGRLGGAVTAHRSVLGDLWTKAKGVFV